MPVLSRFYGIVIRMYYQQAEHQPPHIHAVYGEKEASVSIRTGEMMSGELPPKALSLVKEWIAINRDDLLLIWETQEFKRLDPLE